MSEQLGDVDTMIIARADWYAGLRVDPHSFSRQLARLQDSLRAAANLSGNQRNSFAELVADDVGDQLEQRSSIG
jgi:hypothetical protein